MPSGGNYIYQMKNPTEAQQPLYSRVWENSQLFNDFLNFMRMELYGFLEECYFRHHDKESTLQGQAVPQITRPYAMNGFISGNQ